MDWFQHGEAIVRDYYANNLITKQLLVFCTITQTDHRKCAARAENEWHLAETTVWTGNHFSAWVFILTGAFRLKISLRIGHPGTIAAPSRHYRSTLVEAVHDQRWTGDDDLIAWPAAHHCCESYVWKNSWKIPKVWRFISRLCNAKNTSQVQKFDAPLVPQIDFWSKFFCQFDTCALWNGFPKFRIQMLWSS